MSSRAHSIGFVVLVSAASCLGACGATNTVSVRPSASANRAREIALTPSTTVHIVSRDEGAELLGESDEFTAVLSRFDLQARVETTDEVSLRSFLEFAAAQAVEPTPEEVAAIHEAVDALADQIRDFDGMRLPPVVRVVVTTGREEGGACYTRGTAIVLARPCMGGRPGPGLLAHELFHVISRQDPALREAAYALIGFEALGRDVVPPELSQRRMTNPDGPRAEHAIRVRLDETETLVVPVLIAARPYDGGAFFDYFQPRLLVLDELGDEVQVRRREGEAVFVRFEDIEGLFEKIGHNTRYVIHPDEVLAENFALLLADDRAAASPEVLDELWKLLDESKPLNEEGSRETHQ